MYLINKEETTNSQLYTWTHNLALPYLSEHASDYHLASVYEIEDTIQQQLPREITHPLQSTWTEIGSRKKRTPPTSPSRTRPTTPTTTNTTNDHNSNNTPLTGHGNQNIRRRITHTKLTTHTTIPAGENIIPTNQTNFTIHSQTPPDGNNTQFEPTSNSNKEATHPSTKPTGVTNPYKEPNRGGSGNQTTSTRENRFNSGASTQSTMNTKTIPFIPINDGIFTSSRKSIQFQSECICSQRDCSW